MRPDPIDGHHFCTFIPARPGLQNAGDVLASCICGQDVLESCGFFRLFGDLLRHGPRHQRSHDVSNNDVFSSSGIDLPTMQHRFVRQEEKHSTVIPNRPQPIPSLRTAMR